MFLAETSFQELHTPTGDGALIPSDISIKFPTTFSIPLEDIHYLAYIPWQSQYLGNIPHQYQAFFQFALPHLHARTSDVHTALSVAQIPSLVTPVTDQVDLQALYFAVILHDCGWSEVDQAGLVASLSYQGVAPSSSDSLKPKQQHLIFGEALAYKLLDRYDFGPDGPDNAMKYYIAEIIRRHDCDAAWEQGKYQSPTIEMQLLCDADRLWSYTHENFWLDTIRKAVEPVQYIQTIEHEIPQYFFTPAGRNRARLLLHERQMEVNQYLQIAERSIR